MNLVKMTGAAALLATAFAFGGTGAQAAPAATAAATGIPGAAQSDALETVQYRRGRHDRRWRERHWRRNRHHYRDDWNPAAYIGLGIIGALVSQGLSEDAANSAMNRCASRFRSFEWDTGLYTTYGGEKVLCPYLR